MYINKKVKHLGSCNLYVIHPDTRCTTEVTFFVASNEGSILISCATSLALGLSQPNASLDNSLPGSNVISCSVDQPRNDKSQLNVHMLWEKYQSAYQKFHSCETSMINLVNTILWNMENQKVTSCLIMDLSAAFDTVNFQILEDVLEKQFGVTEAALKWYHNYLSPQQVIVNVNVTYSSPRSLTCRVVQGSVSGPVAYSAYASTLKYTVQDTDQNDDDENVSKLNLNGFADDHSLNTNFDPNEEGAELNTKHRMESKMHDINTWMNGNRLKMNSSKTEFIYFVSRQQLAKTVRDCIDVCGENVTMNEVIKLLGTYLDKHLTYKQHIMTKCKTAMFNIQRIKHIRKYLTKEACEILVMGLVTSHLGYCNSLFYGLPAIDLNKLQCVQNIASKLILQKSKYESNTVCLMELHWLPIHARIEFKVLVYVYNCLNNTAPAYMKKMLQRYSTREGLRSNNMERLLVIPKTKRKTFADRAFSVCGPQLWNHLPTELRTAPTLETFKSSLKTYLFHLSFNI